MHNSFKYAIRNYYRKGAGNKEWNCSAPHGAGRILSRAQARAQVSMADSKASMSGIYTSTCNEHTIDESAFAYKPKEEILAVIEDTISIIEIVKPVYNFKGYDIERPRGRR